VSAGPLAAAGLVAVVGRVSTQQRAGPPVPGEVPDDGREFRARPPFGVRLIDTRGRFVREICLSPDEWRAMVPVILAGCALAEMPGQLPPDKDEVL